MDTKTALISQKPGRNNCRVTDNFRLTISFVSEIFDNVNTDAYQSTFVFRIMFLWSIRADVNNGHFPKISPWKKDLE